MIAAKLLIHVVVGLSPDMPISERCKSWSYTNVDYEKDRRDGAIFKSMCDEASTYAREQMQPATNNFVRLEWIWL